MKTARAGAAPGGQGRGTSHCLFKEGVPWAAGTAAPPVAQEPPAASPPTLSSRGSPARGWEPGLCNWTLGVEIPALPSSHSVTLGKSRNPALELSLLSCKMDLLINHYGD